MRVEVHSGEQLATRSPVRCFGTSAKLNFILIGGTLRILTCKRMAGRSSVLPNEIQKGKSDGRNSYGSCFL